MPFMSDISVTERKPAPDAITSSRAPRPEWLVCIPVSPNWPLSSTTIAEVSDLLGSDRQQAADAHQLLAVAGDNSDRPLRLRQRKAEANHRRAAHRAPEIEICRVLAGVEHVVGG